jgi:hypothetical protein
MNGMMDWFTKNSEGISAIGSLVGAIGQGYAANQNAKYAKSLIEANKKMYNRQVKRQDDADKAFNEGFRFVNE